MVDRFKKGEQAALIGIFGNIVLAVIKGILGTLGNSRALIADAVNSASDVLGSLVVYFGIKLSKQPPDKEHPYGHGKAESIAAIIVAVLVFIVGIEIGRSAIQSFFQKIDAPKLITIYGAVFSIIIKEILFQYTYRLGKKIKSEATIVSAYEHRSDVLASFAVLIGIVSAIVGNRFGYDWLLFADPVASLFVAILILKLAWKMGKESINNTLDYVLQPEETEEMQRIVYSVEDVKKIDNLFARQHGHYLVVDLKISVDPNMSVEEGHRIGKLVKSKLLQIKNVHNVFVHINPYSE